MTFCIKRFSLIKAALAFCAFFVLMSGLADQAMAEYAEDLIQAGSACAVLATNIVSTKTNKPEQVKASGGIYLEGEENMDWVCGIPFGDPGFLAYDKDGEDISDRVETEGEVCCWKKGSYTLTYSFSDNKGEEYQVSRTVNIVPAQLPETVEQEKTIYLTFDDGPCQYTEKVLDILDKYDAKATFFVICNDDDPFFTSPRKL